MMPITYELKITDKLDTPGKHTAGPWTIKVDPARVWSDGEVDHGGYRIDAGDVEQLAFVWNDSRRFGDDPMPFGAVEAAANAKLIAAAPDLAATLAALLIGICDRSDILAICELGELEKINAGWKALKKSGVSVDVP